MKLLEEKKLLKQYLTVEGVKYNSKRRTWRCPNPSHADNEPSATLYENETGHILYCPVCSSSWTIFEVAGLLHGLTEFKDKLSIVKGEHGAVLIHHMRTMNHLQLSMRTKQGIFFIVLFVLLLGLFLKLQDCYTD